MPFGPECNLHAPLIDAHLLVCLKGRLSRHKIWQLILLNVAGVFKVRSTPVYRSQAAWVRPRLGETLHPPPHPHPQPDPHPTAVVVWWDGGSELSVGGNRSSVPGWEEMWTSLSCGLLHIHSSAEVKHRKKMIITIKMMLIFIVFHSDFSQPILFTLMFGERGFCVFIIWVPSSRQRIDCDENKLSVSASLNFFCCCCWWEVTMHVSSPPQLRPLLPQPPLNFSLDKKRK